MGKGKTAKIDFSRKRFANMADKLYNEGDYVSALRFAYKELEQYGADGDVFVRLCDIYEGMGLHSSAINCWFRFLDIAEEDDMPDIYEGLAANFLNSGNESQAAYYYNQLVDADDSLSEETKYDIAEVFAKDKREQFRFVYPPKLADYGKELDAGAKALKKGDFQRAISTLSVVDAQSKDYTAAMEMQAVAHLLSGELELAEKTCKELLEKNPNAIRIQSTLAAVYLEQGEKEKSRELALSLATGEQTETDDLYKVATVCCENDLHEQAFEKFRLLSKKIPYDGRMLYFMAVAAYNSGKVKEAEQALDSLCTIYPDAEVAKYYLQQIRLYQAGKAENKPEMSYFYRLPQEEKERRVQTLLQTSQYTKDEAFLFGLLLLKDGYLHWCFDEMDGMEQELQYVALMAAERIRADEFLREALLNIDVSDVLKVETLRALYERNENEEYGVVLCNIYRKVNVRRIRVGRKRRKRFLEAYAKVASKFTIINDENGKKLHDAAELLYRALELYDQLDLIDNSDDCACAIFLLAGLKDLGENIPFIAQAFDASLSKVQVLMSTYLSLAFELDENGELTKDGEHE